MHSLSIATQILCRMELAHLEDWLWHLHRHAVSSVWLFLEPDKTRDALAQQKEGRVVWGKKPDADFNLTLDEAACRARIMAIVAQAQGWGLAVHVREVTSRKASVGERQTDSCHAWVRQQRQHRRLRTDWCCFLDVDEYLIVPGGGRLREYLTRLPGSIWAVSLRQRLMQSRFHGGRAVPVRELTGHYGVVTHLPKVIFRPERATLSNVHSARIPAGHLLRADPRELLFFHFRGAPATVYPTGSRKPMRCLLRYHAATAETKPDQHTEHLQLMDGRQHTAADDPEKRGGAFACPPE